MIYLHNLSYFSFSGQINNCKEFDYIFFKNLYVKWENKTRFLGIEILTKEPILAFLISHSHNTGIIYYDSKP